MMQDRLRQVEMDVVKHEERFAHLVKTIAELSGTITGMAKTLTDVQVRFAVIVGGLLVLEKLLPVIIPAWRN
jgi:uncharacterized coiled-coil protein SlyX